MCSMFGGPPKFEIQFDSPSKAYYSGTQVTGKILLKLDKPKKVRGLSVKFLGKARVLWREHRNNSTNGKRTGGAVTYSAEEQYFKNCYYVLGCANGDLEIPVGEHTYPFSTSLPHNLPSSFNGEHGKVQYTVTATLERSWKFDHETTGLFSVVTPIDLNRIPDAKSPVVKMESKSFGWFTRSGLLTLNVRLPHSGFVPGETLTVTIEADNASDVNVESVDCKIHQESEFISRGRRTKKSSADLVQIASQGIEPSKSRVWMQSIVTPQLPHINLTTCSIINVRHSLVVVAKVGLMHKNLQVEIPLIMGTVPLLDPTADQSRPPPYFEGFNEKTDPFLPLGFVVKS